MSIDLHVLQFFTDWPSEVVRAHTLLCILACYIDWHLREAWRELMFANEL